MNKKNIIIALFAFFLGATNAGADILKGRVVDADTGSTRLPAETSCLPYPLWN